VDNLMADLLSRGAATVAGLVLFALTTISLMRTVVIPRTLHSVISDTVSAIVIATSFGIARLRRGYVKRDSVLAWAGPSILVLQLITWLVLFLISFGLLLYGTGDNDLGESLRQAGSSLFTLGFADVDTNDQTLVDFIAAATGPIVIALMIGFLPTIYSSYLTREAAVTSLSVGAGEPAWGPEMLSRHSLAGSLDETTSEFRQWTDLAASMRMSHSMYPVLLWVRSSRPYRHYVVTFLSILDAASLMVSLTTSLDRRPAFQLLMQGGQTMEVLYALIARRRPWRERIPLVRRLSVSNPRDLARRLPGWNRKIIAVEIASDQDALLGFSADTVSYLSEHERSTINLTRSDFDAAVELLRRSDFPIERDPEDAWDTFCAARSRYEFAAYALCEILDAPPAPWTGPRRVPAPTVWPNRALDLLLEYGGVDGTGTAPTRASDGTPSLDGRAAGPDADSAPAGA
jgi:hypothetical protein